ncbi:MAG: hypothetical protein WCA17_07110, partial [Burkholderiales bacterium]
GGALVLALDRWLKSESERTPGVLGRYDMRALGALLETLQDAARRPAALSLPGYHKLKRERVESVETVAVAPSDVVILEGTVALALETEAATETHRFHVEIDEEARRQRILNEYRLRGLEEPAAMEVYLGRREDEVPAIERLASGGSRVSLSALIS